MTIVSVREWRCLFCGKLLFVAHLPPDAYVIVKCYRCHHKSIIRPAEYIATAQEQTIEVLCNSQISLQQP